MRDAELAAREAQDAASDAAFEEEQQLRQQDDDPRIKPAEWWNTPIRGGKQEIIAIFEMMAEGKGPR
jgi:hypothetical protein